MATTETLSTNIPLDFIGKLFEKLRRPLGLFLLLIVTSILQHTFDLGFVCLCQHGLNINVLYMTLPSLILTFVDKIVNIFYKKKFFLTVACCTRKCCCSYSGKAAFEFIIVTALWTAMVLFKGDWYFCVKTSLNSTQTELPCKKILTYKEERIKDSYKAESLNIGLGLCCCLLFVWIFAELFRTKCRSLCHQCRRPHFEAKYTKILSDEVSSYIEEELKKIAMEKAKEMCEPKIKNIWKHVLPNSKRGQTKDIQKSEEHIKETQSTDGQTTTINRTVTLTKEIPRTEEQIEKLTEKGIEEPVSQTWRDISDPKFLFTWNKTAGQPVTPGTNPGGQEVLPQGGSGGNQMEMTTINKASGDGIVRTDEGEVVISV